MDLPKHLQICLAALLAEGHIDSWNIYDLKNGLVNINIRIDTNSKSVEPKSYKKVSDTQRKRNIMRAQSYKNPVNSKSSSVQTRNMSKIANALGDKELPRETVDNGLLNSSHGQMNNSLQSVGCEQTGDTHMHASIPLSPNVNKSPLRVCISDNEQPIREENVQESLTIDIKDSYSPTMAIAALSSKEIHSTSESSDSSDSSDNESPLSDRTKTIRANRENAITENSLSIECNHLESRSNIQHYQSVFNCRKCITCGCFVCLSCKKFHVKSRKDECQSQPCAFRFITSFDTLGLT